MTWFLPKSQSVSHSKTSSRWKSTVAQALMSLQIRISIRRLTRRWEQTAIRRLVLAACWPALTVFVCRNGLHFTHRSLFVWLVAPDYVHKTLPAGLYPSARSRNEAIDQKARWTGVCLVTWSIASHVLVTSFHFSAMWHSPCERTTATRWLMVTGRVELASVLQEHHADIRTASTCNIQYNSCVVQLAAARNSNTDDKRQPPPPHPHAVYMTYDTSDKK